MARGRLHRLSASANYIGIMGLFEWKAGAMLRRLFAVLSFVAAIVVQPTTALAQTAPPCQLVLGFRAIHDLYPEFIGDCIDNQTFAANGDAIQHTTNGLLVWRKADNWTAFTDGFYTVIHADVLYSRLNTARYEWEGPTDGVVCPTGMNCSLPASDPTGPLDLMLHLVPASPDGSPDATYPQPTSTIHWMLNPALLTAALNQRLTQLSTPAPNSQEGPPPPLAFILASDGGYLGPLMFSEQPEAGGYAVVAQRVMFVGLKAASGVPFVKAGDPNPGIVYDVVQDGGLWRLANATCLNNPASSILSSPYGWLNCHF